MFFPPSVSPLFLFLFSSLVLLPLFLVPLSGSCCPPSLPSVIPLNILLFSSLGLLFFNLADLLLSSPSSLLFSCTRFSFFLSPSFFASSYFISFFHLFVFLFLVLVSLQVFCFFFFPSLVLSLLCFRFCVGACGRRVPGECVYLAGPPHVH